jgi:hypothetical protein
MAADWAVRIRLPILLDYFGRTDEANELRALPEVVDDGTANGARAVARRIADAGWERRRAAYGKLAVATAAAVAVAAAAAAAAADAAADAVAAAAAADAVAAAVDAAAADAAAAVADAAVADAAVADAAVADAAAAVAAAAVAAEDSKTWAALVAAAKSGGYWCARDYARRLLRVGKLGAFRSAFADISNTVNASAQDLIRRMAAVSETHGR